MTVYGIGLNEWDRMHAQLDRIERALSPAEPKRSEPSSTEPEEPPMTPEEEEQAPPDRIHPVDCVHEGGCQYLEPTCENHCKTASDELTQAPSDGELPCTCSSRMVNRDGEVIHDQDCKGTWFCGDCGATASMALDWCPECHPRQAPKDSCVHEAWEYRNPGLSSEGVRMVSRWCTDCGDYLGRFEAEEQAPENEDLCEIPHATIEEEEACERERLAAKVPPQPERRPPYAVAYSVQGHLYEVAVPGDATAQAVDGALVIQHDMAPVAGIVQVRPLSSKEK